MDLAPANLLHAGLSAAREGRQSSDEHIDAIFAHLRSSGDRRLVVHLHGGLNSEQRARRHAEGMAEVYRRAGAHPVFVVWETGIQDVLRQNLGRVSATRLFQGMLRQVKRVVTRRVSGDEDARGGPAELEDLDLRRLERALQAELRMGVTGDRDLRAGLAEDDSLEVLDPEVAQEVAEAEEEGGRGFTTAFIAVRLAQAAYRVVSRFVRRTDHGLGPTVIEEVLRAAYLSQTGVVLWGGMKRSASEMWAPGSAGGRFLERLARHRVEAPGFETSVVAHSAGSIAACRMLNGAGERFDRPLVDKLAFLAPAVSCRLFDEAVVAHPDRCGSFRMFTLSDGLERSDATLAPMYPRSLLYLVSGLFERAVDEPLLGMMRYVDGESGAADEGLVRVRGYLEADGARRLAVSGGGAERDALGLRCSASVHAGFNETDPLMVDSLGHYIGE